VAKVLDVIGLDQAPSLSLGIFGHTPGDILVKVDRQNRDDEGIVAIDYRYKTHLTRRTEEGRCTRFVPGSMPMSTARSSSSIVATSDGVSEIRPSNRSQVCVE
jgi:hypothetical protein